MDPAELPIGQPVSIRWGDTWYPGQICGHLGGGAAYGTIDGQTETRMERTHSPLWGWHWREVEVRPIRLMRSGEWRNVVAKGGEG